MEKHEWIEAMEFILKQVDENRIKAIDLHQRLNKLTTAGCYNLSMWERKDHHKRLPCTNNKSL